MDQLNDQMNILNNKIDEAKKIKQQSIKLEQALKKLQEFVFEQLASLGAQGINGMQAMNSEEEDTMFAKRPLVGWSCASCDKDIVNLGGRQADYQPWKMMPMRDPTDRISRVGQGFSRMLSSVKPEYIDKFKKKTMN